MLKCILCNLVSGVMLLYLSKKKNRKLLLLKTDLFLSKIKNNMNQIKPVFDKKISQLCHSKEFRVFSYLVIILILITGELYGFFVGTLKVLEGELLLGVTAFLLMSTTTIYFAFINYNLMK